MTGLPEAKPIRTILAATDLSDASRPAIHAAALLARCLEAELHLVHALSDALDPRLDFLTEGFAQKLHEQAEADLNEFARGMPGGAKTAVRVEVRRGNAVDVILDDVKAVQADLLVVGTHGRTGLAHLAFGSVAEHLAGVAPIDLLLVRKELSQVFSRLLVAVKGDEASRLAVARALQVAQALGAQEVNLVSAFDLPHGWDRIGGTRRAHRERMRAVHEEDAAPLHAALQAAGLASKLLLEEGRPSTVVSETAERLLCDLVLLGSVNRPRLTAMLFGDSARAIAHHVPCAVWLVRSLPEKHPVLDALMRELGLR